MKLKKENVYSSGVGGGIQELTPPCTFGWGEQYKKK